jgi:hypothetical protein
MDSQSDVSSNAKSEEAEPEARARRSGLYLNATLGYGAPMGANTALASDDVAIGGGVGALFSAGFELSPNFALGAFLHYNNVSFQAEESEDKPDDVSSSVLLYGAELRGFISSGILTGYGSLGLALGSGRLEYSASDSSFDDEYDLKVNQTVDFSPMPTLAFGVEAKVSDIISIGPNFRWYFTGVGEACSEMKFSEPSSGFDDESKACADGEGEEILPHIVFVGLGLTVRP